jgi:hypothetical protein
VVDAPWLAEDHGLRAGCFGVSAGETPLRGDRGFESVSLQRGVCCEPDAFTLTTSSRSYRIKSALGERSPDPTEISGERSG